MKILALDLGTNTGWAYTDLNIVTAGTESFQNNRFSGGGMRYLRFRNWLTEMYTAAEGIDAVYFEEVRRHAATTAAHVYGGMLAILTAWCEEKQIPYQSFSVGSIKKNATGKGNANKEMMIDAAMKKWPSIELVDDNTCDALWILDLALKENKCTSPI